MRARCDGEVGDRFLTLRAFNLQYVTLQGGEGGRKRMAATMYIHWPAAASAFSTSMVVLVFH